MKQQSEPEQVSLTLNSPIFNPNKENGNGAPLGTWQECDVSCLHPQSLPTPSTQHAWFLLLLFLAMPHSMGILVPDQVEPTPSAVEAWSLNHWNSKEVPHMHGFLLLAVIKPCESSPAAFDTLSQRVRRIERLPAELGAKILGISCLDHEEKPFVPQVGRLLSHEAPATSSKMGRVPADRAEVWHTPRAGAPGCELAIKVHGQEPGGKKAVKARLTEGQVSSRRAGT